MNNLKHPKKTEHNNMLVQEVRLADPKRELDPHTSYWGR